MGTSAGFHIRVISRSTTKIIAMKIRTLLVLTFALLLTASGVYGFFFGPLFPWCPVKPGFAKLRLNRCTILYPKGTQPAPEYATLDTLMEEMEQFHKLRFKKEIQVIVCASNEQCKRFSRQNGHACAVQTGTVLYVRPSIQYTAYPPPLGPDGEIIPEAEAGTQPSRDLTGFLKHELSHALLYQNTSLYKAFRISRWVDEGLAVYSGNPDHYYRDREFRALAFDRGFFFTLLEEDSEPHVVPKEIKYFFTYGAYGMFMGWLMQLYGRDQVLDFIHEYIRAPGREELLFQQYFGSTPPETLERFRKEQEEL